MLEVVQQEGQDNIDKAIKADLMSPKIAILAVPLFSLMDRDKCFYVIEKKEWLYSGPPQELEHLGARGFDSRLGYGILALPSNRYPAWIVSSFSERNVELRWNRSKALEAEYPEFRESAKTLKNIAGLTDLVNRMSSGPAPSPPGDPRRAPEAQPRIVDKSGKELFRADKPFAKVWLRGVSYHLPPKARAIVRVFYEHYQTHKDPDMPQTSVLEEVGRGGETLRDSFKGHIAVWFALFKSVPGHKDIYRFRLFE
jgi:hypothetical protein